MKKNVLFCQYCDSDVKVKYKNEEIVSKINGEDIKIKLEIPYCEQCGKELSDIDLEDYRYELLYTQYRTLKGLLQPSEIKAIREKYELSQRAFSRVLGFAESTINRYELGAIQDNTNNCLIKLAENPQNMKLLLEQNKKNLSDLEISKIINKINQLNKGENINSVSIEKNLKDITEKLTKHEKMLSLITKKIDTIHKKVDTNSMNSNKYEDSYGINSKRVKETDWVTKYTGREC